MGGCLSVRPAGARSAVEVRNSPGSGKRIVKSKGVAVEQHIMAKVNNKLTLNFFDLFRHIISEIMQFSSHYSYELSVQLQTT